MINKHYPYKVEVLREDKDGKPIYWPVSSHPRDSMVIGDRIDGDKHIAEQQVRCCNIAYGQAIEDVIALFNSKEMKVGPLLHSLLEEPKTPAALPIDPDLVDDTVADQVVTNEEPPAPTQKPYGMNGETKCIKCKEDATHALLSRMYPAWELIALVCANHYRLSPLLGSVYVVTFERYQNKIDLCKTEKPQ